ncbi:hypothetical protein F4776DRAFT_647871 [Hypoxylon sp. NC0597]|nr:hypothetical protein F4776DRAFT_647871 [Hypoxylon sp. NC0597]
MSWRRWAAVVTLHVSSPYGTTANSYLATPSILNRVWCLRDTFTRPANIGPTQHGHFPLRHIHTTLVNSSL